MQSWVGPTVAIAQAIMALCVVGVAVAVLLALKEAREKTQGLAHELAEIRKDLSPALKALNHLGESGAEVAELARDEVRELVDSSRSLRRSVSRGVRRVEQRLGDFDALAEVVYDEVEDTALSAMTTLRTVREGSGMIGQLRRALVPGRRRRR